MKTILITGAGTGLGKELAMAYANKGHHLILVGRRESKLEEVKQRIEGEEGHATTFSCDITDEKAVQHMVDQIHRTTEIDQVINNAGIGFFGPIQTYTKEEIDQMIDTNIKGTIFVTKAVIPKFLEKNSGKIMNVVSTAGLRGKVHESVYVASKFAIRGFSESLIKELEHTNVSVSAVYMGGMDTPFWDENNFVTDRSGLKSAKDVALDIVEREDEEELILDQ